jgi:hypothetical protein
VEGWRRRAASGKKAGRGFGPAAGKKAGRGFGPAAGKKAGREMGTGAVHADRDEGWGRGEFTRKEMHELIRVRN